MMKEFTINVWTNEYVWSGDTGNAMVIPAGSKHTAVKKAVQLTEEIHRENGVPLSWIRVESARRLRCQHCEYEWNYAGTAKLYASCPKCLYRVNIQKQTIEEASK